MQKRGPYGNRRAAYEMARSLRRAGSGYRTIAVTVDVPWQTVRRWVADIEADACLAHVEAMTARRKPISQLSTAKQTRRRLIEKRGRQCESCQRKTWLGQPIMLEMHHHNGKTNVESNVSLLCPNCHSMTDNWKKKRT